MEQDRILSEAFLMFIKRMLEIGSSVLSNAELKMNSHSFNNLWTLDRLSAQELTMTRLAEEMGISNQQLTKLVNELEEKGLVIRSHDRKNRRLVHIQITDEGRSYMEKQLKDMQAQVCRAIEVFDPKEKEELAQSLKTLNRLCEKL